MKEQIDFILPSFHSETLTTLAIKSFEKFKGDFDFRYIVVENSDDVSYKENVLALSENVIWIQNPTTLINSEANASGLEVGLEYVTGDYVFFCHNDVVACHPEWMNFLFSKLNENEKEFGSPHTEFKNHLKRTGLIEKVRYVHIGGCVQYGLVRHLGDKV